MAAWWTREQWETAERMAARGATHRQIADLFGATPNAIRQRLQRRGITTSRATHRPGPVLARDDVEGRILAYAAQAEAGRPITYIPFEE